MRQAELEKGEVVERMQRNVETLKQVRRHCFFFVLEFNLRQISRAMNKKLNFKKLLTVRSFPKYNNSW